MSKKVASIITMQQRHVLGFCMYTKHGVKSLSVLTIGHKKVTTKHEPSLLAAACKTNE